MNLLLDTHTFLWFVADDAQLPGRAKELIENPDNRKLVSIATCWEISIKVGLKKLDLGEPASIFLPRHLAANHFELLPIAMSHATLVERLPLHHRDPFDRLLIAQAIVEGLVIIGIDVALDAYGVKRIWN
ncbi:MAG: type II toxin-antitoxin system VapC family toxin [Planctomycetaceae bacterium]|nr:type II toxin-antitoxin system VapC family toxin [Planctomycetaceae bacterium]